MSDCRFLQGMLGLGDNLYQRAVIRELGKTVLLTPWPQIYSDLPVYCMRPSTRLRTQAKNAARNDLHWTEPGRIQSRVRWSRIGYNGHGTMLAGLLHSAGINPDRIDLNGPPVMSSRTGRYLVVRPCTIRHEWRADARNPNPDYLCRAVDALRHEYTIISVADLEPGHEWAVAPLPFAHETYHRGELLVEQLLGLIGGSAGLIGGVGWLLPAALAYQRPMLLIHGGWGHANGPQRIFDPRIDISRVVQAMPDNYCHCNNKLHDCDKTITQIDARIDEFTAALAA